ncbi:ATP-binding protein [Roseibaca sp. V10]|uniref:ATP-binding protein n=1 Tax=Roseinatronobacter domitianus TaxID=2940293 RepID=A0ABT0M495_9RHOB|nr:ATP-binding protein [Roseibaca domitiana]MCL1629468.1 ATP-binding protein [Roseibaca domitiana]
MTDARQPGFDEAIDYLVKRTRPDPRPTGFDEDDLVDASDDPGIVPRKPYPDEILDALAILRLCRAVEDTGDQPLSPARGLLTTIVARTWEDRKRLAKVIPELSSAQSAVTILTEEPPDRNRNASDFIKKLEGMLELGRRTIAILSTPEGLSAPLAILETARVIVPPLNARMLTLMLEYLYPGADIQVPLTDLQIARLPPLAFGPAFVSEDVENAIAHLRHLGMRPVATTTGPTLDDVHGQPEAVGVLRQVVRDLEAWRAGKIRWAEVTRSFLLYGPPGTGKTLLAHALAGSAGIGFVKTSYSDCQRAGHQGDMLRELNAAADRAITGAPAAFFVDEIDSFYARDMSSNGYVIGVVNGLLTLLDRLSATEGVVLIAATNDPKRVDPAVIRSGRFDRHIRVSAPNRAGIRAMLEAALR